MATDRKTIFITGANTGLGLEIVKALCKSNDSYHIFFGSRDVSKGEAAIQSLKSEFPNTTSVLELIQADLSSDSSLEAAVEQISSRTNGRLDTLLNNAGGGFDKEIQTGALSIREAWNKSWDTNISGTQVLTTLTIPLLLKSSDPRLMFMTSGTSSLVETEATEGPIAQRLNASPEKGWPKHIPFSITSYRSTKTGLNMLMREWTKMLRNDGVKVWCISPGFLATNLGGATPEMLKKMGALDPAIGGEFCKDVVEGKYDEHVGRVIRKDMVQPW